METLRPTADAARRVLGGLQMMYHRRRGVRWITATAAAIAVLVALNSGDPAPVTVEADAVLSPADRLPAGTRGVVVPTDTAVFAVGNAVDVHEVRTGAAVVHGAVVVDAAERETVVAVSVERVNAVLDALATGGAFLVLVPSQAAPGG